MQLALDMGPTLNTAHERRWHGPAAALAVHLAIALLIVTWPASPPPGLDEQIIELILAPPPAPEPPAAPVVEPVKPAAVKPVVRPTIAKPAPSPKAVPADAAPIAHTAPAAIEPAASAALPASAAPSAAAAPIPREPDLKPHPTEAPRPVYPRAARQRGWHGVVMVLVRVAEDGVPLEVAVKESSGHTVLDEAALDAVKRWRFSPARQNGRPVTAAVEVPVRFSLEG